MPPDLAVYWNRTELAVFSEGSEGSITEHLHEALTLQPHVTGR